MGGKEWLISNDVTMALHLITGRCLAKASHIMYIKYTTEIIDTSDPILAITFHAISLSG